MTSKPASSLRLGNIGAELLVCREPDRQSGWQREVGCNTQIILSSFRLLRLDKHVSLIYPAQIQATAEGNIIEEYNSVSCFLENCLVKLRKRGANEGKAKQNKM